MKLEDIYESFFDTYRNMGYMISELSRQTLKTAAVEADRRAKESDEAAKIKPARGTGTSYSDKDKEAQDLARKNAEVKSRQAKKFKKELYVQSGGTARADAVPDYKSGEQKKKMDTAALKRHPQRDPKGKVSRDRAYVGRNELRGGGSTKSAYGEKELERQRKRYGR
jgi:hypothetical protein